MRNITFLINWEIGHLHPTIGLAREVVEAGHDVTMLGIADACAVAERHGLRCVRLFENDWPLGAVARFTQEGGAAHKQKAIRHLQLLVDGAEIREALGRCHPDLLVTSYYAPIENAFVWMYSRIPQIILTTELRAPEETPGFRLAARLQSFARFPLGAPLLAAMRTGLASSTTLEALPGIFDAMPEGITCPSELDDAICDRGPNVSYLGPCIRTLAPADRGRVEGIVGDAHGLPIVLVSLGSQADQFLDETRHIFNVLTSMLRLPAARRFHFVVMCPRTVGPLEAMDGVTIVDWLPQLELLPHVAAFITHGGLGTVKECVLHEVPMIVVPLGRDQPDNGRRVVHHGLGLMLQGNDVNPTAILEALDVVVARGADRTGLRIMADHLRRAERERRGAALIERCLSRQG